MKDGKTRENNKKENQQWLLKYMFISHNMQHLIDHEYVSFLHTWDS